MSAVIEELRLRNFGGYREANIEFSAGLNLIRGRNSTGKSTLLDGLVFALFGETPDVKPRLLISRFPDSREMETYVRFRSPKNGAIAEVMRKGRVDSKGAYRTEERRLLVNGEEIVVQSDESLRAKITELMGSSFRKFLNLVYVRQGKLTEILQPSKDEMDSIIGITLLRELREQTEEARRTLERYEGREVITEIQNLEKLVIPQLEKNLEQLSRDVEILQEEVQKIEELVRKGESREMTQLLREIGEKEEIERKIGETRIKIEELCRNSNISTPAGFETKISEMMFEQMKLLERKESLEKEFEKLSSEWSSIKGEIVAIEESIKEHEALLEKGISECPTCGQNLEPETLREIMSREMFRSENLRLEEEKVKKIHDNKKLEIEQLNKSINNFENEVLKLKSASKVLSEYILLEGSLNKLVCDLDNEIRDTLKKLGLSFQPEDPDLKIKVAQQLPIQPDELARKKAELEKKRNSLIEKIGNMERIKDELKISRDKVEMLKKRIKSANVARSLSEKFDQGIEARRQDFLKNVEYKALEYYKDMTDQHIYGAIRIDPEEYTVLVHPKGLIEQIPATRIGGGHQTIIALSIRLALLELLGFHSLLILDEPTYGIDSENLPQLASYIGEVSRRVSQMILVTHHNICEEEALNIIDVKIGEDGASKAEVKL